MVRVKLNVNLTKILTSTRPCLFVAVSSLESHMVHDVLAPFLSLIQEQQVGCDCCHSGASGARGWATCSYPHLLGMIVWLYQAIACWLQNMRFDARASRCPPQRDACP